MNGLKCIRTQCNFSLSDLATRLGVSRQMISAWENGRRKIPIKRLAQLSDFFGIEQDYFGEISDSQKELLLNKAMFRYVGENEEHFLYKPYDNNHQFAYFMQERKQSIAEEFAEIQRTKREILEKIEQVIDGPPQRTLTDQICYLNRGNHIFQITEEILSTCYQKSAIEKMVYYQVLENMLNAIRIAFLPTNDNKYDEYSEWQHKMAKAIMSEIERRKPSDTCAYKEYLSDVSDDITKNIIKATDEYSNEVKNEKATLYGKWV